MPTRGRRCAMAAMAGAGLLLAGCASLQEPDVERVATNFVAPSADAAVRCALLAPATRAALEQDASASCPEAIQERALHGGHVESVKVWGGTAQVRLSGDTLFLAQTRAGWRVTAAGCRPRGEAPYDYEVEGP